MKHYRGIGLMSGTSLDGVDLAYCEFTDRGAHWSYELLHSETVAYDEQWYARLRCLDEQNAETFAKTDVYFGHLLGRILAGFIDRNELKPQFAASHGQTIFHQPDRNFTSQIGDGETIVSYLPCPLVSNFRNKDVALGGQGAPLVPFGEALLFPEDRLFLNLGGIANLTRTQAPDGKAVAFDVSPCNMALNWLASTLNPPLEYDPEGSHARKANMNYELFAELEARDYYREKGPKSLGTEWFEAEILPLIASVEIPVEDRLKTFVIHIVSRITVALRELGVRNTPLVVTGGGAHNRFLMEELEKSLAGLGISIKQLPQSVVDYKEALIFAFLGLFTLLGKPNVHSSVTGAKLDCLGGSIHLPPAGVDRSFI